MERELADEIRVHLDELTRRNVTNGMSPEEAHGAALGAFGDVEQIKQRVRGECTIVWLEALVQSFLNGFRIHVRPTDPR